MGIKKFVYYFNINKQIDVNKKNQYQESCVLFFPRHDIKDSDPDNIKIKTKS